MERFKKLSKVISFSCVKKSHSLMIFLSLFQNEWTEAVDTGGRDGTPGANSDGS